jgi:tetratricopeptide (TPR) repeat protein
MNNGLRQGFGTTFLGQFHRVKSVRALNVHRAGTDVRAVIRVMNYDGALNYIELLCEGRPGGKLRAVDMFNWTTGEYVSETMRHMAGIAQQQSLSLLERLTGKEDPNVQLAQAINEMNRMAAAGEWEAVLKRYAQLPPKLQREKVFALHRARAAAKTDQKEYLEALKFWQVNFPRDPSIDLIAFDGLYFQKKYDVALDVVNRMDRNIGGDPFLEVLRAVLQLKLGRTDLAKERTKEALRREPELIRFISPELTRLVSTSRSSLTGTGSTAGNGAAAKDFSKMRLQGIFLRNDHSSALIGGQTVYEGDMFEGMQVVKIEKARVTLQSAKGELQSLTFD